MKLNSSDVLRLYGKKLFVLDGWEKSPVSSEIPEVKEEPLVETLEKVAEQAEVKNEPVAIPQEKEEVLVEAEVAEKEEELVEEIKEKVEEKDHALDLSCFSSGPPVVWKMKPSSRLALILQKSEFSNRDLTGLLKASIVKAGIDPALVGFGVIEDGSKAISLGEMSVQFALICNKLGGDLPRPVELSGKKLWLVPALSEIASQPEKQKELDNAMQALAAML